MKEHTESAWEIGFAASLVAVVLVVVVLVVVALVVPLAAGLVAAFLTGCLDISGVGIYWTTKCPKIGVGVGVCCGEVFCLFFCLLKKDGWLKFWW